ncbi:MAG: B3/B4 domain-containing protein [Planctomycetota bacterium]|jgi:DNA/RNA-binding domain of Phe-tRNA-synthetase-like protein
MIDVAIELPVLLAVVEVSDVRPDSGAAAFDELTACAARHHAAAAAAGVTSPGAVDGVETARSLFRALGIDPTRHRPCSEALLKRALRGAAQPRVSTLVDVGNWCALDFLLPLGVYDRERVVGPVVLRRGRAGETYLAISGREINLADRYALADDEGPFGSPITDSQRTAIRATTRIAAIMIYAPPRHTAERLRDQAALLGERVVATCGGTVTQCEVIGGVGRSRIGGPSDRT